MKLEELVTTAKESFDVHRVYTEPFTQNGVTIIAAASVSGGAGGGSGLDPKGQQGEGGGFGMRARPVGAYVIKDGSVRWVPAIDPVRILVIAFGAVGLGLLRHRAMHRKAARYHRRHHANAG